MKRLVLLFLTICCSLSALPAAADTPLSEQEIRDLFGRATDHANKRENEKARDLYLQIWQQRKTYDTALNLAQIAYGSEDFVAAAKYARAGLEVFPPSAPSHIRNHFESLEQKARANVAVVNIEAPSGAVVKVDNQALGTAPISELLLEPGSHRFEASLGGEVVQQEATVEKGSTLTLSLDVGNPAPPNPANREGQGWQRTKPKRVPLMVGGALAVVGVGLGVGYSVKAGNKASDADALAAQIRDEYTGAIGAERSACAPGTPAQAECSGLQDLRDEHDRARNTATWSFALGGTAAAATLAYLFWPRKKHKDAALEVAPTTNGFQLRGRF